MDLYLYNRSLAPLAWLTPMRPRTRKKRREAFELKSSNFFGEIQLQNVQPELYLRKVFEDTIEDYVGEKERYSLLEKFVGNSQGPILDAGCGCEEPFIVANRENAVAFDFTKSVINTLGEKGYRGHRVLGSVVFLPFRANSFEKIVCSEVVLHLPTIAYAENCIRELERAGDAFIVTIPKKHTFTAVFRLGYRLKRTHPNLLSLTEFRRLFAELPVIIFTMFIAYPHIDSDQIPFLSRFNKIRLLLETPRISKAIRKVKINLLRLFFPKGTSIVAIFRG